MPAPPKVAINGFGRIGRLVTRALLEMDARVEVVAVNDLGDPAIAAHLFEHDSLHGRYDGTVAIEGEELVVDGTRMRVLREADPGDLPWKTLDVDVVVECTGSFRTRDALEKHRRAGAKRVLLSAPANEGGVDVTIVRGVNDDRYDPEHHRLVSNASCTTNCLAPVLKVLHEAFTVEHAVMTTIHAYTNGQRLLDAQHKDARRARAAGVSMVPTTTGAASAIGLVIPELAGKVDGLAVRVPTPNVSLVDLAARVHHEVGVEPVLDAFRAGEEGPLAGILRVEWAPLVSVDFNHDPHSAIVDAPALTVVDGNLVKVLAWYDNEWAYAVRTAELAHRMAAVPR
ncbi:MAG TPA: type I glyceraldehyde-3-phosphate dehydrogenase [Nitriliruptorales bacterium]